MAGDALSALELYRALIAEAGGPVSSVTVGNVSMTFASAAPVLRNAYIGGASGSGGGLTDILTKSVAQEWGGPAFEAAVNETMTDLVPGEDEQPAIRGDA